MMQYKYQPHKIPRSKEEWFITAVINAGIYQAFSTVATWTINQNMKMHYRDWKTPRSQRVFQSYKGPSLPERWGKTMGMVVLNPATPVVAGAVGTTFAVAAASAVYEQTVNEEIRSGHANVWRGPFASGFGPVV